ncbi:MAG: outer membrane protein [Rhabdaerophilum sp.]
MSSYRLVTPKARFGLGGLALALTLAAPGVQAADYLRGTYGGHQGVEPIGAPTNNGVDWAGTYVGIHAGMSNAQTDSSSFRGGLASNALPNSAITDLLASTINFRKVNKTQSSFGAFAGINYLWDDVVLGVEVDYTRAKVNTTTSFGPYGLMRTDGAGEWHVTSTSTARAKLTDWGTLRGRVGWAAGNFMPYLTAGIAFANIDGRATTTGSWQRYDVSSPPARPLVASSSFSGVIGRSGITYGGAIGAGVDVAFFSNVFVRAEWQHIQLASGGNRPQVSINTARVAGAVKF